MLRWFIVLVLTLAARAQQPAEVALGQVEVRGTGPVPIVLIPPLPCDWSVFEPFMERNLARYTMYAITLPGMGAGNPPPAPDDKEPAAKGPWLAACQRAIEGLIAERKLDHPYLVGQSLGGLLAMKIATDKPDLCRGTIVINAWPAFPVAGASVLAPKARAQIVDGFEGNEGNSIRSWINKMEEPKWMEQQRDWLTRALSDKTRAQRLASVADRITKAIGGRYMLEYFAADITDQLGKNSTRLLVIAPLDGFGKSEDSGIWRELWKRVYGPVPKATLVFLDRTKEFVADETPEQFDRLVETFIKGEPITDRPPEPSPAPPPAATAPAPTVPLAEPKPTEPKPTEPKPQEPK